jgi:protein TonB
MKTSPLLSVCVGLLLAVTPVLRADSTEAPVPVRTIAPEYPGALKRSGVSGLVTLSCLIDEKGDVQDISLEKASDDAFIQPAIEAVKKWKFKPAKKDGVAVAIKVSIPVRFRITES